MILDFFVFHVETDTDLISTTIEMNFYTENEERFFIIECEGIMDDELSPIIKGLQRIFNAGLNCTWMIKNDDPDNTNRLIVLSGDAHLEIKCSEIKVTTKHRG